jgi:hypothetical protein
VLAFGFVVGENHVNVNEDAERNSETRSNEQVVWFRNERHFEISHWHPIAVKPCAHLYDFRAIVKVQGEGRLVSSIQPDEVSIAKIYQASALAPDVSSRYRWTLKILRWHETRRSDNNVPLSSSNGTKTLPHVNSPCSLPQPPFQKLCPAYEVCPACTQRKLCTPRSTKIYPLRTQTINVIKELELPMV